MPKWLKPELNTIIYWLHLGIIGFVVLLILQLLYHGDMLNIKNVLWSIPMIGLGDVISHTITRMD